MLICLLGISAAVGAAFVPLHAAAIQGGIEPAVFLVAAILLGGQKLVLIRHMRDTEAVSISAGFMITFAAMLRLGPVGAVLIGVLSSISGSAYPKPQAFVRSFASVNLAAVGALLASVAYLGINGWTLAMRPLPTSAAVAGSALVFFVVETAGFAIFTALLDKTDVRRVWKDRFLWKAPAYFAAACASSLGVVAFGYDSIYLLFFAGPVVYLTHQAVATYARRTEESIRRAEEIRDGQARLAELYRSTIQSLALAIDAKDQYTNQRILRVQRYAVAIARQMGFEGRDLDGLETGALLHDIGKLGVPEYVLLKPGKLTDEEFEKIKKHPETGAAILDSVDFPWPVLPVIRHHHEKWDGTGYPDGLKGEDIPVGARILAVADVYDALTSSRSYRNASTHEQALEVISKDAGSHFDPRVVEAFKSVVDQVVVETGEAGGDPLSTDSHPLEQVSQKAAQAAADIARTSADLWALYEVSPTLSASLGLKETIDVLAMKLESIYPGTTCVFLLRAESNRKLRAGAALGLNHEFFNGAATVSHTSLSMRVSKSGESYLGEYDKEDLLLTNSTTARWTELRSSAIVPIRCGASVLGTINLYHTLPNAFTAYDIQRLEMFASRGGMAIYNGILHDRSRGQSATDSLTGLFNLRHLTSWIEDRCATSKDPFALLCIDMNNFKAINDTFGHVKGDKALAGVAKLLRSIVGRSGTVARYGGDEFLVILDDADRARALSYSDQILSRIDQFDASLTHSVLGDLKLAASIGVSCFPEDGRDCSTLLYAADQSMYNSKTHRKLRDLAISDTPQRRRRAA